MLRNLATHCRLDTKPFYKDGLFLQENGGFNVFEGVYMNASQENHFCEIVVSFCSYFRSIYSYACVFSGNFIISMFDEKFCIYLLTGYSS
jgi:hypothetical protein